MKTSKPRYSKADMKILAEMSVEGSVAATFLPEMNYSPLRFRELLEQYNLSKDIEYLYEMPLREVPKLINQGEVSGYLSFRLKVRR
jgi:hypothetical protein